MNLPPPPEDATQFEKDLYEFLKNPVFESLRLKPRSSEPDGEKGRMYYDSDTDLFYGYTGSFDEFGDIT